MSKKKDENERSKISENDNGSNEVSDSETKESGIHEEHEITSVKDDTGENQSKAEQEKDSFEVKYQDLSDKYMRLAAELS